MDSRIAPCGGKVVLRIQGGADRGFGGPDFSSANADRIRAGGGAFIPGNVRRMVLLPAEAGSFLGNQLWEVEYQIAVGGPTETAELRIVVVIADIKARPHELGI